jgi:hypothetical protein
MFASCKEPKYMGCILTSKMDDHNPAGIVFSFRMEDEQYGIVKFLHFKKMRAAEMHNEFALCFSDNAYTVNFLHR